MSKHSVIQLYLQPRMFAILVLGFASGLPLALSASVLYTWLADAHIDLKSIGLFAVIGTPYTLKFLWAPLIDGIHIPLFARLLGKRRSWLLLIEICLMLSLVALGFSNPVGDLWTTAFCALLVAIFSATQDIIIDAYRVEILPPDEQGGAAGAVVLGYRFGMIASGGGALILADHFGWAASYMIMAALLPLGFLATLVAGEPQAKEVRERTGTIAEWLHAYVIAPFSDFMTREAWFSILLFIMLYKLGDAFMGVMTNPFLIELGFSKTDIGVVVKTYGVVATIVGSLIGGGLVLKWGTVRSLIICGVAHALTNLMFVLLAHTGPDQTLLASAITLENISGGMGTAAFVAFISGLTHREFTATQYALLSSFSAFGRTWLSAPAGWFAQTLGWGMFFTLCVFLAVPGLLVLWWLNKKLTANAPQAAAT